MGFQTSVQFRFTTGYLGEVFMDSPTRSRVFRIDNPAFLTNPNTVGKAFTFKAATVPVTGNQGTMTVVPGAAGAFAGIAVMPKHYALYGTPAGGSLAPSMDLPDDTEVELMTMGMIIVSFPAAVAFGDPVYFIPATGALTNVATANTLIVGAKVINPTTAAGLSAISLLG